MIELTETIQKALDMDPDRPLHAVDPRTNEAYVIIKAARLARIKSAADGPEITPPYELMDDVARNAGWDDSEWDTYDLYAVRK